MMQTLSSDSISDCQSKDEYGISQLMKNSTESKNKVSRKFSRKENIPIWLLIF
jgi:hypothetical protein